MLKSIGGQHLSFLALFFLSLALFREPLGLLLNGSLSDDRYSHVFFIPLISALLIYFRRETVFHESTQRPWGGALLVLAMALYAAVPTPLLFPDRNNYLSCSALALLFFWGAAFLACYGWKALCAARFPLGFLVLMIPLPTIPLDRTVEVLQKGSAAATHALFLVLGVPAVWQGVDFSLNGHTFEVATECSGIHSCLVLFVSSILAGHLFVQSLWARVCFSLSTILVAIFKNAIRIGTISYLTAFVDDGYYNGWLHRHGGVPFSLVALALLVPLMLALQKAETYAAGKRFRTGQFSLSVANAPVGTAPGNPIDPGNPIVPTT